MGLNCLKKFFHTSQCTRANPADESLARSANLESMRNDAWQKNRSKPVPVGRAYLPRHHVRQPVIFVMFTGTN